MILDIRRVGVWLLALVTVLAALPAAAQPDRPTPAAGRGAVLGVAEAEALVRGIWYEGLPLERAARIGPAGAARLVEMLDDPSEAAHHANVLVALGASGRGGAYETISAWAARPRNGPVDRDTFRAWQVLPHALGNLARHDRRALAMLEEQLEQPELPWRFRHHDGGRIARLTRDGAATALAASGLPEAPGLLQRAGRGPDGAPAPRPGGPR